MSIKKIGDKMKTIQELQQERGSLVDDMQNLLNKAGDAGFNAEDQAQYDKIDEAQAGLKTRIDNMQKAADVAKELGNIVGNSVKPNTGDRVGNKFNSSDYKNAFEGWTRGTKTGADVRNALEVGTNSEGGFIVPEEFETMLVRAIQDVNPIRQWCNVITTSSDRNIPIESTLGSATWTAEEAAYSESDAAFGQVVLSSHKLTSLIKVSEELVQDSFFDLASYLAGNFGSRFALAEESAFVAGDGSGKPTGIVTGASDSGVDFASTTAITGDELIDVQHALARPYRSNAIWLVNDSTLKLLRKLKDGDSQYLWQPGLQAGSPDTLLGRPIYSSTAMPAATAGLNSVVFGDLSGYTIADRSQRTMQRLNELYAENGQIGFRMFSRTDGNVTDSNKIVYAEQAAS